MSDGFSPADLEYATRTASPRALENALDARESEPQDPTPPEPAGPRTGEYLEAFAVTRSTVSAEVAAQFLEDIADLARR